jgi:hypothetical protein
MAEAAWIQSNRRCSCCYRENLWARLTEPSADGFGKRLYTYCCRFCDFTADVNPLPEKLKRALRSDTGYDAREDPELL